MSWKKSKDSVRTLVYSVAILALTVAALVFTSTLNETTSKAAVKAQPLSPSATFPANAPSLGLIPDGVSGCAGAPGTPLNVTFNVSGLSGAPTAVSVNLTGTHTWMGDVTATLIAPDSTSFLLFGRTGTTSPTACGDSSDIAGPYNFTDSAAGTNWWAAAATAGAGAAIPTGDYRTTAGGPQPDEIRGCPRRRRIDRAGEVETGLIQSGASGLDDAPHEWVPVSGTGQRAFPQWPAPAPDCLYGRRPARSGENPERHCLRVHPQAVRPRKVHGHDRGMRRWLSRRSGVTVTQVTSAGQTATGTDAESPEES